MVGGASDARSAADNASDPFAALGSGSAAAGASSNVIDPLAGLGSPARGPSLGLDDLDPLDSGEVDRGLAKLDPLAVRPRISSRVLCAVFGLLLIAAGFGIWWVCVFTEDGQSYDELVWKNLSTNVPDAVGSLMSLVAQSWLVIAISCLLAVIGVVSALVRRRWWLVGQIVVFAAVCLAVTRIKGVLPRPFIINTDSPAANSAPSGHTMLAAACAVILLLAVPRVARALAGIIGVIWSWAVGVSVIYGQWHRPSDVAMSILLVAGLALIVLVFTDVRHGRAGQPRLFRKRADRWQRADHRRPPTAGIQRIRDLAGGSGPEYQRELGGVGFDRQRHRGRCRCCRAHLRSAAGFAAHHCRTAESIGSHWRASSASKTVIYGALWP